MGWRGWRSWLLWAGLAPTLIGCKSLFGPDGPPQDPLFVRKDPVEVKADFRPPGELAWAEPVAPSNPFLAGTPPMLASEESRRSTARSPLESPNTPRPVPGILTNRPPQRD